MRATGETFYAGWWWTVLAIGFVLGWLAVMTLPRLSWRWAAVRGIARAALAAVGARPTVRGLDQIPRGGAVLLFNHSSYADTLVVAASIPGEPAFVAKKELAGQLFAGPLLRRLGVLFLDRFELTNSLADLDNVTAAARQNRLLVFFPEGTFSRRAGLSGFYLGAFQVAAQAKLPVVPGILRGTRTMLRSDQWLPRWSRLRVTIERPIMPAGTDLSAIVRLRDAARAVVLAHCGEPDLIRLMKPARTNASPAPRPQS
jgi:1-acyl-sn-glycerol-3-phosphate acyltransferase